MIRITNQYAWYIFFTVFFAALIVFGVYVLETMSYQPLRDLSVLEIVLLSLAAFRLTRLFVYDSILEFFRDQFYDEVITTSGAVLVTPERGPRRVLAELLSCPWCFGLWSGATVVFFYALTPYAYFPVLFFAIAGVASFLQVLSNLVGWRAEEHKKNVERL